MIDEKIILSLATRFLGGFLFEVLNNTPSSCGIIFYYLYNKMKTHN